RDGIVGGQSCILVANEETARLYESELNSEGVAVSRALESGRLQVLNPFRTPDEGLETCERSFSAITRRGGLVIRLLGEAVQNRDGMRSTAEFFRFEDALTPLARRFPVVIVCQYDVRLLSSVDMVSVLKTHADNFDLPLGMFLN
ncbi:MAG TPA: MEDS domain-containing protein, partial [Candidatus Dormibacteraeota bacterium]|nr:MEDS domain-containing protein [Candidatus Dormibacteraeota bacterium]